MNESTIISIVQTVAVAMNDQLGFGIFHERRGLWQANGTQNAGARGRGINIEVSNRVRAKGNQNSGDLAIYGSALKPYLPEFEAMGFEFINKETSPHGFIRKQEAEAKRYAQAFEALALFAKLTNE